MQNEAELAWAVEYLAKYSKYINIDFVKKHITKIDKSAYEANPNLTKDFKDQILQVYDNYQDLT
jgi:hypothetical protein